MAPNPLNAIIKDYAKATIARADYQPDLPTLKHSTLGSIIHAFKIDGRGFFQSAFSLTLRDICGSSGIEFSTALHTTVEHNIVSVTILREVIKKIPFEQVMQIPEVEKHKLGPIVDQIYVYTGALFEDSGERFDVVRSWSAAAKHQELCGSERVDEQVKFEYDLLERVYCWQIHTALLAVLSPPPTSPNWVPQFTLNHDQNLNANLVPRIHSVFQSGSVPDALWLCESYMQEDTSQSQSYLLSPIMLNTPPASSSPNAPSCPSFSFGDYEWPSPLGHNPTQRPLPSPLRSPRSIRFLSPVQCSPSSFCRSPRTPRQFGASLTNSLLPSFSPAVPSASTSSYTT
ncbi:hypothetical protein R3P38DRAFT_2819510 [Favolaschia claudopus]|uniref:Uncharacterized protein n=1 Tax=Favolaschia claudopus TaxID=2862362 RepID=A0AAW0EG60_9AGAR